MMGESLPLSLSPSLPLPLHLSLWCLSVSAGAHICHHVHVEVRRQPFGVSSLLPLWALGIELRLADLCDKHFDPLSHLTCPLSFFNKDSYSCS